MAATSNRDYFFQTTASIEDNDRKQRKSANTYGSPVKFPTKLLALQVNYGFEESGDVVFVAEASGTVSALRISTNEVSRTGRTSGAPLTCLAYAVSMQGMSSPFSTLNVFAGCWDKSIINYEFKIAPKTDAGRTLTSQNVTPAHQDFVKCLAIAPTADRKQVLISGGADGELNFWTLTGTRLSTLRPNHRAIECIALDPLSSPDAPVIFFSTSQREIFQFTLPTLQEIKPSNLNLSNPIIVHETSVYKLHFDGDGDLWTASADKTAKHLSRDQHWSPDTTLAHPDFVRDIVTHDRTKTVITACRDEEIRVWNGSTSELLHIFTGHYEEVTGLAVSGDLLISISIDATLRRWSLAPEDLRTAIEQAKNPDLIAENPEPQSDLGMLTAEEEAELKALMEEDDAETLEKMAVD